MPIDWMPYLDNVPAVTRSEVEAYESRYDVRFPDAYRTDLVEHRGMAPERDSIKFAHGGTAFGPLLVPSAGAGDDSYTIATSIDALRDWSGASDWSGVRLWPFATNTASGLFCLDYRNGAGGEPPVVFVDLGYDLDEEGAVTPVADSYAAALEKLQ